MCYYNRLIVPVSHSFDLLEFHISLPEELATDRPMQGGFEYGDWPIIVWSEMNNHPEVRKGHWEFLAPWAKNMDAIIQGREKFTTLNAIGEKIFESALYKDAALKRRCLVPSSGFYEWRHWKPADAKKDLAIPYFISLPAKPVFFMGGVWGTWTDRDTGELFSGFAIVTTLANSLMAQVHNKKKRMPLILTDALALEWISPGLEKERIAEIARFQYDPAKMNAYTIEKEFRTNLDPLAAFTYEGLPSLSN